ncbi:PilT protein domain protein [Syntrophobotulus glycolicus DSM 8271]|uniref:PilT protein domain protein n=1 Tax=Syntrophobotulus glycolicus (strain DSM 8271 / FlGlyR) TaxID=645991 RepID=F0SU46_SYNGF|nr:PIN domain-containing protein [Syntrophobotulus glycolicus]ADY55429.1 PilT protein domain protein [Syntrophobotulus glycolicus DSM 8271]
MKVLVDTSVWSLALRRHEQGEFAQKLSGLIREALVVIIGPVRQELLSGISNEAVFSDLKEKLGQFDDLPITTYDYETAAQYDNICRKHGVQGSHIDFLICAAAGNHDLLIYTTDQDFKHFAAYLPIRLL